MRGVYSSIHRRAFELSQLVHRCASRHAMSVYLVGGVVRDLYIGESPALLDVDFTVVGDARRVARAVAEEVGGKVECHDRFMTAKVTFQQPGFGESQIDLVTARRESYPAAGKLPEVVPSSLTDDLWRRDFSVNALALDAAALEDDELFDRFESHVIDPTQGLVDLQSRKIRVLHANSFRDDPTRIFRAVRYQSRLAGEIEDGTLDLLLKGVAEGDLLLLSEARRVTELLRVLEEPGAGEVVARLEHLGVWRGWNAFGDTVSEDLVTSLNYVAELISPGDRSKRREVGLRLLGYFGDDLHLVTTLRAAGLPRQSITHHREDLAWLKAKVEKPNVDDSATQRSSHIQELECRELAWRAIAHATAAV